MSLNAATIEVLLAKGLTGADMLEIARAMENRADPTNAARQARHRAKKKAERNSVTVTRDDKGSNERDNLTSQAEGSEPSGSSPQPRPWTLPVGVSLQVWTDLLTNRKRKRLPNTPTAWKGFLEDLERVSIQTGIPPPQLIERCAAKGWGAIYDPREAENGRSTNGMGRNQPASDGLSPTTRAARAVFGEAGAGGYRNLPQ